LGWVGTNIIYINSFKEKFEIIATFPYHGRFIQQEEDFEVRLELNKKHKILYQIHGDYILIARIFSQRFG